MPPPSVGIALLAAGNERLIRTTVLALSESISRLESSGVSTASVIVDRTTDPGARMLVGSIGGGTTLAGDPEESEAGAYVRAIDAMTQDVEHVLLCATDAAPIPGALEALHSTAIDQDADLVLPAPQQPGSYALVHRRALEALAAIASQGSAGPTVLEVARWLKRAGARVTTTDRAGSVLADVIEVLPTDIEQARGAYLNVARPDAVLIGHASYFGPRTVLGTWGPLEQILIGSYCSFARDIRVLNPGTQPIDVATGEPSLRSFRGSHDIDSPTTFPMGTLVPDEPYDEMPLDGSLVGVPLTIGSDVWVGSSALILGGITIGHGAVIGAGAVVMKDVPPFSVVVGNPATVRRRRFDDATCDRLLAVSWWRWHPDVVAGNHRRFSESTEAFLDRFDPAGALEREGAAGVRARARAAPARPRRSPRPEAPG